MGVHSVGIYSLIPTQKQQVYGNALGAKMASERVQIGVEVSCGGLVRGVLEVLLVRGSYGD